MQGAPCEICLLLSMGRGGMVLQHLTTMKCHPTRAKEKTIKKNDIASYHRVSVKNSTFAAADGNSTDF